MTIVKTYQESQLAAPEVDQLRVSPEFATAAELIDKVPGVTLDLHYITHKHKIFPQNLDKGFDPDDPAVKGIEDWDCSNNLDAMDPSLDNLVRETVNKLLKF